MKMPRSIAEAAHMSQHFGPTFTSEFIPHVATPFRPYMPAKKAAE